MRLRRLELHGFKTFASRAALEFSPGITAVVGPNGSGKSNIADAVRWVLGEQSLRLLRGRKSEDVIFGGGSGRAPQGMAEVTLVLEDAAGALPTGFAEVAVGRRVYRSGEGEYYLNRTRARLRDVVDLLSRAGIGQNGHSVIGQGMVDLALSQRPEERRALFEDAAGVRRYQARRDEAMSKLAEVRANATRVADLIAELEPRLAQLLRQARRAQEETRLRQRWQEALRAWLAHQRWEIDRAREQLEQARGEVIRDRLTAEGDVSRAAGDERAAGAQLAAAEAALADWQREQGRERDALDAAGRELAVQRERLAAAERRVAETADEAQRLARRLATAVDNRSAAAGEREVAEAEVVAAREQAMEAGAALRAEPGADATEAAALAQARREAADAARLVTQTATQLREVERQAEGVARQKAEATDGQVRVERARQSLAARLNGLDATTGEARRRLESAQQARQTAGDERSALQARLDETIATAGRLDREVERLRLRLGDLDALLHGSAGTQPPAGGPTEAGDQAADGTVAAALRLPAEVEAAVAAAAGPALQWVLVDTFRTAAQRALAQAASGGERTTFVARDVIERRTDGRAGDGGPDSGGTLYRVLRGEAPADSPVEDALRRVLLGQVDLVDDLPAALDSATSAPAATGQPGSPAAAGGGAALVVTRRGEVVSPAGWITAGSPPGEAALLQRTRERREAQATLAALTAQRAALDAPLVDLRAEHGAATAAERRYEADARALAQQVSRDEGERRALAQQQARLEADVNWWADFAARVGAQHDGLDARRSMLERESATARADHEAAAALVQRLTLAGQRRQAARAALQARATAARTRVTVAEAGLAQVRQRVETATAAAAAAQEDLNGVLRRQETLATAVETARLAVATATADVAAVRQRASAGAENGERLRQIVADRRDAVAAAQKAAQRGRDATAAAEARAALLDERRAVVAGREEAIAAQAARELGDLPPAQEDRAGDEPLRRNMETLQGRLLAMGPVNQVALQEHAEAAERLRFLKDQLADLRQATTLLESARAELDAGLQADFAATFEVVASHFGAYFTRLFGGGEAELRLTDPEHAAESGVEIFARLPGKRRQELALLSGGERALTASALLFALIAAHPGPFCILDEVDAALDEANVGRFCDALEALSQTTQFILITHNRATMERAGALYGVTLGEDGVSRVLSLRLAEAVRLVGTHAGTGTAALNGNGVAPDDVRYTGRATDR